MSALERLALGVLLPAFPGTTLAPDVADLLFEGLGGVCLFGSNTAEGPDAVGQLTAAIAAIRPEAVVAVDEEGGDVTRLHADAGSPVLGPAALGAVDDLALTRLTARAVGRELNAAGITLDLGPVADVNTNPDNPVIGTRSFGSEPARVAAHVGAWVAGLQETGIGACAKHFPGHGDTALDSHLALPTVSAGRTLLAARELVPFAAAVEAGVAAIMTSHIVVPALDPSVPATFGPVALGLLRARLGFTGVILTDALDMAGACAGRGIPEAAVLALRAGADLLCLGADKDAALVRAVQGAVVEAVRVGRLSEARLVEATERVGELPARSSTGRAVLEDDGTSAAQLTGARRAIRVEGELPTLADAVVVSVATDANIAVGEVPWGIPPDRWVPPGAGALVDVPTGRTVVLQVRDAHRHPGVGALLDEAADHSRTVVVVEWGWAARHDRRMPRIITHGCSRPGIAAVTELLRENGWDR